MFIVDTPNISYNSSWGMGLADVSASFVQMGDVNTAKDLYSNGLIPVGD